jgi:hypothetical protein
MRGFPPFGRRKQRASGLDLTQTTSVEVRPVLDLAIVVTATLLALLTVTLRSFGRALAARRAEIDR